MRATVLGNRKILLVAIALVAAFSIALLTIPDSLRSYSLNGATDFAEKMSASSGLTTITIDGQAAKSIHPDQITIISTVNGIPTDAKSALSEKPTTQENLIKAIKEATNDDPQVQVIPRASNVNPSQYAPGSNGMYVAYISIPIKMKIDSFTQFSKVANDAGFRVDYVTITPVQQKTTSEKGTTKDAIISIPIGSSSPNCADIGNCYSPKEITVGPDSILLWQNDDTAAHTITSGNPSTGPSSEFDSGLIAAGKTFSHTFTTEGTHPYFCLVHPWMTGTIIVSNDAEKIVAPTPKFTDEFEISTTLVQETKPDTLANTIQVYKQKADQLKAFLQDQGIEEKNTQSPNISINPMYYGAGKPTSFSSYSQFMINTTPDHLEKIIDAVIAQKGTVEGISMSNSDSLLDSTRKELTQLALDDAKSRASEIIDPMGLQIKGIKSIKVSQTPQYNQYGNPTIYNRGVVISADYSQSGSAQVSVTVEFEVGK